MDCLACKSAFAEASHCASDGLWLAACFSEACGNSPTLRLQEGGGPQDRQLHANRNTI